LPLYAVLAVGDVLNGFYFSYANFNRLRDINDGTYFTPTSKWACAMKFYSFFQLTGTQFPALIALIISIERCLAVQKPIWFHVAYGRIHRIIAVVLCLLFLTFSLTVYYVTTYPFQDPSIPPPGTSTYCALTYSAAGNYNHAHQAFITVTRVAGFALSAFAFFEASKKSRQVAAMRKEARQVAPILAVSIISLLLITIPQVGLLLTNNFEAYPIFNTLLLVHWILLLTCINSLTNIFVYILFTRDFRRRVICIITFNRVKMGTSGMNASTMYPRGIRSQHPNPVLVVS
jgi:hypothetical protein